jgi:phosphoglycolate phosphatase-like HAD superfamily hydrolase
MLRLRLGPDAPPRDFDLVFLDCDGVIFDMNAAKAAAFRAALAGYPKDAVDAMIRIHRATGGVSRYVKLRRFFTELCPVDDVEGALREALSRFGAYATRAYGDARPLPEALDFATLVGAADVYVVSGSDQEELRAAFRRHALDARFADVLGSPETKPDHLRRVLGERGVPPDRALFVGDGRGDLDAAAVIGLPFVFLAALSDWVDGRATTAGYPDGVVAEDWATLTGWIEPATDGPRGRES